jgi:hypothetical protein
VKKVVDIEVQMGDGGPMTKYRMKMVSLVAGENRSVNGLVRDTPEQAFDDAVELIKARDDLQVAKIVICQVTVVEGKCYEPVISHLNIKAIQKALKGGEEVKREK